MRIHGIDDLSLVDLADELERGGKFVVYEYCVSVLILTFKQPTNVYFIRGGESALARGLPFVLLSLVMGWWGIPWGPIYTIWALVVNLGGGRDVTREILAALQPEPMMETAEVVPAD